MCYSVIIPKALNELNLTAALLEDKAKENIKILEILLFQQSF